MPDIFDEVEEDLRAERARALGRRYWGVLAAIAVLILVGTGGTVAWQQNRAAAASATADRFIDAARQADHALTPAGSADPANAAPAEQALAAIAAHAPTGYSVLARLRLAAVQWQTNQHPQAIATWQAIADDTAAPRLLRDLATLTGAEHQVDTGNPVLLKQRLQSLTGPDNAWRTMAEQIIALLEIRQGRPREAALIMQRLAADPLTPAGIREMAADLLTTLPPDALSPPATPKPAPAPAAAPIAGHAPAAHG